MERFQKFPYGAVSEIPLWSGFRKFPMKRFQNFLCIFLTTTRTKPRFGWASQTRAHARPRPRSLPLARAPLAAARTGRSRSASPGAQTSSAFSGVPSSAIRGRRYTLRPGASRGTGRRRWSSKRSWTSTVRKRCALYWRWETSGSGIP